MLAKPLPEDFQPAQGEWAIEEKLDGHRIVVHVDTRPATLFGGKLIRSWSRYGIERILPPHLREALENMPEGVYDGELLVPGKRSYGTADLENSAQLVYVIFDVLNLLGKNLYDEMLVTGPSYDDRRALLMEIFKDRKGPVQLAWSKEAESAQQIQQLLAEVWARDGEGLILKRRMSSYLPGKRTRDWLKIKQLRSAVLTVVAFREGKLGPHSVVLLRDEEGFETTVKWKNLAELAMIDKNPTSFIGRKLRIEFQERTPDGSYRHPRWDRWENE